jgi:hypothetical protein
MRAAQERIGGRWPITCALMSAHADTAMGTDVTSPIRNVLDIGAIRQQMKMAALEGVATYAVRRALELRTTTGRGRRRRRRPQAGAPPCRRP